MKVRIIDIAEDGTEMPRSTCPSDLRSFFDASDDEYFTALRGIEASGRYWIGGGAAPLVLIMRVA